MRTNTIALVVLNILLACALSGCISNPNQPMAAPEATNTPLAPMPDNGSSGDNGNAPNADPTQGEVPTPLPPDTPSAPDAGS